MPASHAYPPARKADVVDDYHGVQVADPYRWLEAADAPDTVAWVNAENALTRSHVDGPAREALAARLSDLFDYPRASAPVARGGRYFFSRNSGLQNQAVLYAQDGLDGAPRPLVDPNALSADGTTALTALAVDDAGTLAAYGLSERGSDRQEIRVREVATGRDRPDRIAWVKFAVIAWTKDGAGFFYNRFPEPGTVPAGEEHYHSRVYFHRLGDGQAQDRLVYERPDDREIVLQPSVSHDGRWLVIAGFKGASDRSEVVLADLGAPGAGPVTLFAGFTAAYHFIDGDGGRLYFQTDEAAPRGRVIAVDPADLSRPPVEVVPESPDTLAFSGIVAHRLVLGYLHDASSRVALASLDGTPEGEVALPEIGTVAQVTGDPDDRELFLAFTSFTYPPAVYRYDFDARTLAPFGAPPSRQVDPSAYETRQVWYPSKDGTRVSMFLVHRKGLALDGARPVLLNGYGGFNISLTPGFDPANFVWLDRGGVFAVANLRGGGEYGEAWHEAGMRGRKQNVFDDFIAAAEWLVASGYTSPAKLAIEGGSNGGLLVGAALVQRPDLFGAVVCRVPVADMLRYHLFTVGRFWIPEYGSSDDPEQFAYLYRYSPLHNVRDGVAYPATLVMTADTDDRVSPGMAKKFAARLQAATAGPAPVLIRVETKAGHGAGKPVSKLIDEDADIFAFLFRALDV
jgi:prolyl oligopeptidase